MIATWLLTPSALAAPDYAVLDLAKTPEAPSLAFASQVEALERAIGIPPSADDARESRIDPDGRSHYDFRGDHRYELIIPSGALHHRDLSRFAMTPTDPSTVDAPSGADAIAAATAIASALATEGLIVTQELDFANASTAEHLVDFDGDSLPPAGEGPFHLETMVQIQRVVAGVPVAGQGVRVWLGDAGAVHGVDVLWRGVPSRTVRVSRIGDLASARAALLASLERGVPPPDLLMEWEGLAYVDLDAELAIGRLEPIWLFVFHEETDAAPAFVGGPTTETVEGKTQYRAFQVRGVGYAEVRLFAERGGRVQP